MSEGEIPSSWRFKERKRKSKTFPVQQYFYKHIFFLYTGLLLGYWYQPKGGRLAHTAKEKASVWGAGESNLSFTFYLLFLLILFLYELFIEVHFQASCIFLSILTCHEGRGGFLWINHAPGSHYSTYIIFCMKIFKQTSINVVFFVMAISSRRSCL